MVLTFLHLTLGATSNAFTKSGTADMEGDFGNLLGCILLYFHHVAKGAVNARNWSLETRHNNFKMFF